MTENAERILSSIERPTDNPTQAENDMNFMQKADIWTYKLKKEGEAEEEEYQILRDQSIRQTPRLKLLRDREVEHLNNLEG